MVDTTQLAGCSTNKEVKVILPYRQSNFVAGKAIAFVNGFEIDTFGGYGGSSVYEVQIINVKVSGNGVSMVITGTTSTKIYNVVVSFIAWSQQCQYVTGNTY